eukprot:354314-Chlamydomonas_euryale.AAC.2
MVALKDRGYTRGYTRMGADVFLQPRSCTAESGSNGRRAGGTAKVDTCALHRNRQATPLATHCVRVGATTSQHTFITAPTASQASDERELGIASSFGEIGGRAASYSGMLCDPAPVSLLTLCGRKSGSSANSRPTQQSCAHHAVQNKHDVGLKICVGKYSHHPHKHASVALVSLQGTCLQDERSNSDRAIGAEHAFGSLQAFDHDACRAHRQQCTHECARCGIRFKHVHTHGGPDAHRQQDLEATPCARTTEQEHMFRSLCTRGSRTGEVNLSMHNASMRIDTSYHAI